MNKKTTVTVTAASGQSTNRSSDTVMVFTVDGFKEVLEGKADSVNSNVTYAGKGIPSDYFAEVIANMIICLTKNFSKNPIETSFQIY